MIWFYYILPESALFSWAAFFFFCLPSFHWDTLVPVSECGLFFLSALQRVHPEGIIGRCIGSHCGGFTFVLHPLGQQFMHPGECSYEPMVEKEQIPCVRGKVCALLLPWGATF